MLFQNLMKMMNLLNNNILYIRVVSKDILVALKLLAILKMYSICMIKLSAKHILYNY